LVIPFSRGVCGAAARTRQTQLVPDVDAFPGHIACASSTRSEIVLPVFNKDDQVIAVLDIDSNKPDAFTEEDGDALAAILAETFGHLA
jgi:GAF domain-containing protein